MSTAMKKSALSYTTTFDSKFERMPWPKHRAPDPDTYKNRYSKNAFTESAPGLPGRTDLTGVLTGSQVLTPPHCHRKHISKSPHFDQSIKTLFEEVDTMQEETLYDV
jgi:hypothetical protein